MAHAGNAANLLDPPDRDLARRAKQGSLEAFEALAIRYEGRLLRYARLRLGGGSDAEDIVQETLVKAYRALSSYRDELEPGPWLFAIARNTLISHLRRLNRRLETPWDEQTLHPGPEGSLQLEREDWRHALWDQARDLLDERAFDALWLRYGEAMSVEETARVLGCRPGTAKVLLHRARRRLLRRLPEEILAEGRELAAAETVPPVLLPRGDARSL